MTAILVTQRADDWHACIESDAARWGCWRTIREAIGDLGAGAPGGVWG